MVEYIKMRTAEEMEESMQNSVQIFTTWRFLVTKYMVDRKFYPLRVKIGAVDMNITGAAEHAPEV